MRLLLVHPGPSFSTNDVHEGLRRGLEAEGHQVFTHETGPEGVAAAESLHHIHRLAGMPTPTRADVLYRLGHSVYPKIIRHAIEAVVVVTSEHWHPDHTILIRRAGLPVGVYWTEGPYLDEAAVVPLSMASVVWTNERLSVETFREAFDLMGSGTMVEYLPTAYDDTVHFPGTGERSGVVFVGTGFAERIRLLESVNWDGIDLDLYGDWRLLLPTPLAYVMSRSWAPPVALVARTFSILPGSSTLLRHVRGGIISNDKTADLYRSAAVAVNLFRGSIGLTRDPTMYLGEAQSLGPRMYELAATGTFVVSEYREEIKDLFRDLVPTFQTASELESLLRYWLPRRDERVEIGKELSRVVAPHSYRARAKKVVQDLATLRG